MQSDKCSLINVMLTIMVFLHLKLFLPQEYIPLCDCFSIFHWRISIFVWFENIIYLKNIHLCTSVFQFLLLKNTFVWVDSNGIAFTWIFFLPEEYTPLYKSTKTVFSTLEKKNYPNNIHLCVSWQKWHFLHLKCFLPEEYTPLCKRISIFSM